MANLIERHAQKIVGVLSCFDRLVLQGTLPSVAYPQAVATELDRRGIGYSITPSSSRCRSARPFGRTPSVWQPRKA